MSEATIPFADHDQIRAIFGANDQYLRHVRDSVGIDVVVRGDDLCLRGSDEQIRLGMEVFNQLRSILEKNGSLKESEVIRVLGIQNDEAELDVPSDAKALLNASVDLLDKANRVTPRSTGQADYIRSIRKNDLVFCSGPAGCGKTYLAVAMAINALRSEQVRKIVLVRPAVEAGEKLGFLPGDLFAKVNPYLRPLLDALNDILDCETVKKYIEKDVVEIVPLAFMRGRTLNNTFIILDEGQNTTVTQMKMFLTRMGVESKVVVTGDTTQIDLPSHINSGLIDAMDRLENISGITMVKLTEHDIVRHRLVKELVRAYEETDTRRKKTRKYK